MHAAVLHALGKPPRYEQFPEPVPGDGEVIVHVRAASLKPIDKQLASGSHYATPRELPLICGPDGVGYLGDGQRVFFGGPRAPYGAKAQRTVVRRAFSFPVPDGVDDETAAALPNPGVSAWLSLTFRAKLAPGENVLILGATGVTGKLAVKIAKLLGAGRIVAAGRNQQVLSTLRKDGADATIRLDAPAQDLSEAFACEAGPSGFQVVIDYVWGRPTEIFLAAITQKEFCRGHVRDSPGSSWGKRWTNYLASRCRAA
jgi:NADPH:quinone reductase-like Zn-dependent oxidoreductase